MAGYGTAPLRAIFAMLDACAPGHRCVEGQHNWIVLYNGRTFNRLPKGAHGKANPDIELGHVKSMCRKLGLVGECCERMLPQLKGKLVKKEEPAPSSGGKTPTEL